MDAEGPKRPSRVRSFSSSSRRSDWTSLIALRDRVWRRGTFGRPSCSSGRPGTAYPRPAHTSILPGRDGQSSNLRLFINSPQDSVVGLDHRAVGHHCPRGNDDDAVADGVVSALAVWRVAVIADAHVAADAAVPVQDGPLDHRAGAHPQIGEAAPGVRGPVPLHLEAAGPDQDRVAQGYTLAHLAAHADDAALEARAGVDHGAVA